MKQLIVRTLRKLHLLPVAEHARFYWVFLRDLSKNRQFVKDNGGFQAPPLSVMHDAHNTVSYSAYWISGTYDAGIIAEHIKKHHPGAKSVLEWGCGPARLLRHLPGLLPQVTHWAGTDYNPDTIAWCKKTLKHIHFTKNELAPPLPISEKFDVIYGISVLTHLSDEQQKAWIAELRGKLNPGGILLLTTHGENSAKLALLPEELSQFTHNGIVVRSNVQEGKRCFVSYSSASYTRDTLFGALECVAHVKEGIGPQDVWVLREK